MKATTKKILTAICSLILCVFMLAGCNLIEINKSKYYSQTVVAVKLEKDAGEEYKAYLKKYSKKDLITAYYNYAYQYVSGNQISAKDGVTYAINNMVNSDILYTYVKNNYFDNPNYSITFTDKDKNEVMLEVYDSIQDQITTLEKEVYKEWNINYTESDDLDKDETEPLRKAYEPYSPKVKLAQVEVTENGTKVVKNLVVLSESELETTYDSRVAGSTFTQEIGDPEVSKEAYNRYIKSLQTAAKAEGKSTDEQTVLQNEIERLKEISTRSRYLKLFEKWYNVYVNFTYDAENNLYILNDNIANDVVEYYKERFIAQKNKYTDKNAEMAATKEQAYHTAMAGDSIDDIYYHLNSGNEYMYVSHILLKFTDAQKAEIKDYKNSLDNGNITQGQYDAAVKAIANSIKVTYEENGETHTATSAQVIKRIQNDFSWDEVSSKSDKEDLERTLNDRAKRFNDYIYMFNEDEGMMNKDYPYVVNLDTEVSDKMVKEFADASRALKADYTKKYANEELGNYYAGEGALSEPVITEYGVHIIYHNGLVRNVVEDIDTLTFEDLIKAHTQRSSEKTLFAKIYDTVAKESYNTASSNFIQNIRKYLNIEVYNKRFADLLK